MFQIADHLQPVFIAVAGTLAGLSLIVAGMLSFKKYYKIWAIVILLFTYAFMHVSAHNWTSDTELLSKYDVSKYLLLLGIILICVALILFAILKRYALRFTVLAMLPILLSFNYQAFVFDSIQSDSKSMVKVRSDNVREFHKVI